MEFRPLDNNGLLYFMQKLKGIFQKQEAGKGLSANDFTDTYKANVDANTTARHFHDNKTVLDGITTAKVGNWDKAEANKIDSVKVNGTPVEAVNKVVDITVPTDNADLANGAGYAKTTDVESTYQKKEAGKVLSSNDFTDAYRTKVDENATARHSHANKAVLDGITNIKVSTWDSHQTNVIEVVKVNGTALDIDADKAVDVVVPTKVSELTNDSNFIDATATVAKATADGDGNVFGTTYAKIASPALTGTPTAPTASVGDNSTKIATTAFVVKAVTDAVGEITGISFDIVESLPETGETGVIYLMAHAHGSGDSYDEYIWLGTAYEKIGNTDIDLSDYVKAADIVAITNEEIDEICK